MGNMADHGEGESEPAILHQGERGLATAKIEQVMAGGRVMEVRRIRITEVGALALAASKSGPV